MAQQGGRPLPMQIEAAPGDEEELNASEKRMLSWIQYTISGVTAVLGPYTLSQIQPDELAKRSDKSFVVYRFCLGVYALFIIVSHAAVYRTGLRREWLPMVSMFAIIHLECLVFMGCYESHVQLGTSWDILGPLLACGATVVALIWSILTAPEWFEKRLIPNYGQHQE